MAWTAIWLIVGLYEENYFGMKFDQEQWAKTCWPNKDCVRGRMVTDTINNHIKSGMMREEVEALLGQPDLPQEECRIEKEGSCYYLGAHRRGFIKKETILELFYSEDDKLTGGAQYGMDHISEPSP